jgi:REP element-mobilizing transposase RayT
MPQRCGERGVAIRAYYLMPNHIHPIAVPRSEDAPGRAVGEAHRRYTRRINFREKWRANLWQGRSRSFVVDEPYLAAAAKYAVTYEAMRTNEKSRQGAIRAPRQAVITSQTICFEKHSCGQSAYMG